MKKKQPRNRLLFLKKLIFYDLTLEINILECYIKYKL